MQDLAPALPSSPPGPIPPPGQVLGEDLQPGDLSLSQRRHCSAIIIKTLKQVGHQQQSSSRCSYTWAHKSSLYKPARVG